MKIPSTTYHFWSLTCAKNRSRRDLHISCADGNFLATVADSAATPSKSNVAVRNRHLKRLLSSQRVLRKRDRWNGLMVMVMGELFCVCVREGWVMVMGDARFSCKLLKFANCPYGCLTALYGRSVFRGVPWCFLVFRQLLHLHLRIFIHGVPWC